MSIPYVESNNNEFLLPLFNRGFVMRKHAKQLNSIAEPIKTAMNDPEILKDVNGFSLGEATFETPAPEAMIEWQENEIQELSDFFQSCNKNQSDKK